MIVYICDSVHVPLFMWVSPNGNYFPVQYTGHFEMAWEIVGDLVDKKAAPVKAYNNPEQWLEDNGWVKVSHNGYLMGPGKTLSQAQLPIILEHYDECKGKTFNAEGGTVGVLNSYVLKDTLNNLL